MALQWSWLGVPGLLAALVSVGLAAWIYHARPTAEQNRLLAIMIFLTGLGSFFAFNARLFITDASSAFASYQTGSAMTLVTVAVYMRFLGTIESPLARPLRWPAVQWASWLYVASGVVVAVGRPGWMVVGMERFPTIEAWSVLILRGPLLFVVLLPLMLVSLYAVAVALSAVRSARTATARRRAMAYAAAFVWLDVMTMLWLGGTSFPSVLDWLDADPVGSRVNFLHHATRTLGFDLLLAWGVLRTQLFHVELRVKFAISKSTVAGIVIAVVFAAGELASNLLSGELGLVVGVGAAGVLMFFLAPLQRLADRLSERALPHVRDTPEYRSARAREMYEAAFESAVADGAVSEKEKDLLAALAESLGLGPTDVRGIERMLGPASAR